MKKIISILVIIMMLFSCAAVAYAEKPYDPIEQRKFSNYAAQAYLSDGTLTLVYSRDSNKILSEAFGDYIGEITEKNSDRGIWPWDDVRQDITEIVFDTSFSEYYTSSGKNMFKDMSGVKAIIGMENLNMINMSDANSMFYNCSSLEELDFSQNNTHNIEYMNNMFRECNSLTSINLTGFDTTNVVDMSMMFHGCKKLTSIDISGFDFTKLLSFTSMFGSCSRLKTIYCAEGTDLNKDSTSVPIFSGCTHLVGGSGTKYSGSSYDKLTSIYAHVDGGKNNPGYFTVKNQSTASIFFGSNIWIIAITIIAFLGIFIAVALARKKKA